MLYNNVFYILLYFRRRRSLNARCRGKHQDSGLSWSCGHLMGPSENEMQDAGLDGLILQGPPDVFMMQATNKEEGAVLSCRQEGAQVSQLWQVP